MFPLFLNLTGKLVVVVGAGAVGRRKTKNVLDAGGTVRLVALEMDELLTHPYLTKIVELYSEQHLEGAALVFAAGTPELNRKVVGDARQRGIWVNSADDPEAGDFLVPATLKQGSLQIAISTGGAAPSLSKRIRDQLALQFDQTYSDWIDLLAEIRPVILECVADAAVRSGLFQEITELHWLDRIREFGLDSVRQTLQQMVKTALA